MSNENLMSKRWLIACAGVVIQLVLGTVYAWSVFVKPVMAAHNWTQAEVAVVFMIIIGTIGVSAAFGGILVDKKGPKFAATTGVILYGIGVLLGGVALKIGSIWLLYIGYGVIAGIGNGLAYVVPIATLIRWFPDKRGLITGLAVMGFGLGAFFIGKIVPGLILNIGVANAFFVLGAVYLVANGLAAMVLRNPPAGWLPDGFTPSASTVSAADSFSWDEAKKTPQWYMIWGMLFLNVSAGMGLISKLSPMAQDVFRVAQGISDPAQLAILGGGVLAMASIFNGLGRLFWAAVSDKIGRKNVFLVMFATQAALYFYLPAVTSTLIFTVIACYLLSCLGGGFAVMPAFAADSFGPTYIGKVYGFVLTAWGAAGVIGGLVFAKFTVQPALWTAAALLCAGFVVAFMFKRPQHVSHYRTK
ncbi:MAG: OFA family MFS transporter [Deltaproteobacteria bacterium]|jgi:MFS transporter, OFA family, oxalate/formate antiporter|nr:OFA family MFS transporter [Deltaproteobacteria bacterium]